MKKLIPLGHSFLFGIFPVIFLFNHNKEQLIASDIFWPLLAALGLVLLSISASWLLMRDKEKTALAASAFLILFFSYGHIFENIWKSGVRHRHFFALWLLIFLGLTYVIKKSRRNLSQLNKVLNLVAAVLVVMPAAGITQYGIKTWQPSPGPKITPTILTIPSKPRNQPDIYYLILDEYAREDTLRKFGYDNSEFLKYLEDKGFTIIKSSRSNYSKTIYSISSTLNMEYNDNRTDIAAEARRIFQSHEAGRFLQSQGYKYIHFGSWWQRTFKSKMADENINISYLPEFSMILYRATMLHPISMKLKFLDDRRLQWKRINYQFEKMAELPQRSEPTFAFAHFIIPHLPYVFDKNGEFLTEEAMAQRNETENYLNQLMYLNEKIKKLVEEILAKSEQPPIIVLQSDHGTKFLWKNLKADYEPSDIAVREVFSNFMAYYLPAGGQKILYDSMTPVNSFRLLFNHYFGSNYEILLDKSFFILKDETSNTYKTIDATDQTK